jgi:hypothetical protein
MIPIWVVRLQRVKPVFLSGPLKLLPVPWTDSLRHTQAVTSEPSTSNPLTPNDPYSGRAASLTSKRCILYTYPTNIGTEYFKRVMYSPRFSLQNAVCFIILTYLVPVLLKIFFTGVLKLKKIIPAPKG